MVESTPSTEAANELIQLLELTDRREPAVVEIAVWVALGIIEGRLRPGQDLNSVELANRFQSSRTPVREALALLESEGLVEMRARRRPRVAAFSPQQVREVFVVRAHLLSMAGQLAATQASDDDLATLSSIVDTLKKHAANNNDADYRWTHYKFFDVIADIAGNVTMKGILNSLFIRTLSVRRTLSQPERLAESLHYAGLTLEALKQRDGELVALLMRRSVLAALAAIERSGYGRT